MKIPGFSTTIMDESTSHLDKVIVRDELFIASPGDKLKEALRMSEHITLNDIIAFVKKLN